MANNNKHTGPNVPALRFPEFSGEWEQHSLSDYLRFKNGLNPDAKRFGKGIKFISVMDILNNASISYDCVRASVAATEQEISDFEVEYGDVLFQRSSETLEDIGRSNIYVDSRHCVFGGFVIRGKKIGEYEPYFMKYRLDSPYARKSIIVKGAGAQHFNIGQDGLSKVELFFPKYEEQVKIGDLLRIIDDRINTQSKIIEEQETLLKSLADKLISAQSANVAICGCVDAKASTMKEGELESHGAFPVFGASGLCGYSNEALEESDSILVTKDGSGVGTCQYATGAHSFLGTLCSLTAKEGVYLPYVYYALLNFNFASFKTGLAIPHIYFKDYGKAVIYCPSYDEQVRIASGLEKIEAKIKSDKELLKQYQLQKEYLLTRMFI